MVVVKEGGNGDDIGYGGNGDDIGGLKVRLG